MSEKRFALILASAQYKDKGLHQLVTPAQDAEALARVLEDPSIGGFEVQVLSDRPSHTVRKTIDGFFIDRRPDDLLLLYFSGHGIKDLNGQLYLATIDTERRLLRSTAVSAYSINEMMRLSRSRKQVLLLDCCYSGAFARGMVAKADARIGTWEHFGGEGRAILTASDSMQYAFEGDEVIGEGRRSVFTDAVVHGLETGQADLDRDGYVSLDDLYKYVVEHVAATRPQQQPEKWLLGEKGKMIIARSPRQVASYAGFDAEDIETLLEQIRWRRYHDGSYSSKDSLLAIRDKLRRMRSRSHAAGIVDDELSIDELRVLFNVTSENIKHVASYDYGMPPVKAESQRQATMGPSLRIARKLEAKIADSVRRQPDEQSDSILSSLRERYGDWVKPWIVDVRIIHKGGTAFLEVTSAERGLSDEELKRVDLGFIVRDGNPMFSPRRSAQENADFFFDELDLYSVVMTGIGTLLFTEEGVEAAAELSGADTGVAHGDITQR
ncbi:MAG: caspase family protein [Planctomycetota bacterium]|jgi:hypothetical protein